MCCEPWGARLLEDKEAAPAEEAEEGPRTKQGGATQVICHGGDKHRDGSYFGEGFWGLQLGTWPGTPRLCLLCFALLLAVPRLLPVKPRAPVGLPPGCLTGLNMAWLCI